MRTTRILAVALPVLCAAVPLGHEYPPLPPAPVAHAVDVWLGHAEAAGIDPALARAAERERLFPTAPVQITAVPPDGPLGSGFSIVGSVAVLQGDDLTASKVMGNDARRGIEYRNLQEISRRFIEAFGDNYDQIAVFLSFTDYMSAQSLAYQMRVKNDVRGIILTTKDGQWVQDLFDASATFGSPTGRLQTVLNMKRILAYGRGAADDASNDLYAVWAQEAAHRWAAYLHVREPGDRTLLGRQLAHWTKGLQADASIMDGYLWTENQDGTFTAVERDKRYGALDQYAMGLLPAAEVPPFFLLEDIKRAADDVPLGMFAPSLTARYKARKVSFTIDDVIKAMGPREPATDPAAADLRMGVVLLTHPAVTTEQVVGEAYRIDRTRRLWDEFYNEAGGGRGKVCTQLLRPCRGPSLAYGAATLKETGTRDGVLAPGDTFSLTVPVTNEGNARAALQVKADGRAGFAFTRDTVSATVAPGASATLTFDGKIALGTPCGTLLNVDLTTVEKPGRVNPSRGTVSAVVGAKAAVLHDFESPATGWTVDPDGTDTATTGRWEQGTPERSEAFEFTMQPGAAWSGTGTFVTGAAFGPNSSANDVTGGLTTLESPALPTEGVVNPRLSYQLYFVAADFQNEVLVPGGGDSLRVLASADGKAWLELERVSGMSLGWQRRLVRLPAELEGQEVKIRFVVEDTDVPTVVEAVIDDVALIGDAPSCSLPAPDGGTDPRGMPEGCNCRLGGSSDPGASSLLVFATALATLLARRRRPFRPEA